MQGETEKQLEKLLDNIREGLKRYSVKELNEAIIKALNKKQDKSPEIDFVIESVAEFYKIPVTTLKKRSVRGIGQTAKQMAYCLLHVNLGIPQRHIAGKIFDVWPNSVAIGIRRFKRPDKRLNRDKEFIDAHTYLSEKLVTYITTEK